MREDEDEVEIALSIPCLYTSEEKLDTGLYTGVVSGIRAVVRGTDTRYMSQKPVYVGKCQISVRENLQVREVGGREEVSGRAVSYSM